MKNKKDKKSWSLSGFLRQMRHHPAHRIPIPSDLSLRELRKLADGLQDEVIGASVRRPCASDETRLQNLLISEMATCLWYLKTKYFRRDWKSEDPGDDDPRVRRALGRIYKTVDALKKAGIEIQDRTGERYWSGTESVIKPIQILPTPGLTFEKVIEMVVPIVNLDSNPIQRGEAFIAVPDTPSTSSHDEAVHPEQESPGSPASSGSIPAEAVDMPPRGEEIKSRRTGSSRTKDGNTGDKINRSDRKGH